MESRSLTAPGSVNIDGCFWQNNREKTVVSFGAKPYHWEIQGESYEKNLVRHVVIRR